MIRQRKEALQAVLHVAQPKESGPLLDDTHVSRSHNLYEAHD